MSQWNGSTCTKNLDKTLDDHEKSPEGFAWPTCRDPSLIKDSTPAAQAEQTDKSLAWQGNDAQGSFSALSGLLA